MGPAGGGSGRPGVASQILRESVPQSRVRITQQQSVCGSVICDKCETDLSICEQLSLPIFCQWSATTITSDLLIWASSWWQSVSGLYVAVVVYRSVSGVCYEEIQTHQYILTMINIRDFTKWLLFFLYLIWGVPVLTRISIVVCPFLDVTILL